MNVVLQSNERTLLSVSAEELVGICSALNEICNDRHLADVEFQTRLGVTREFLVGLLNQMPADVSPAPGITERADVWATSGAVHMLCISASVTLSNSTAKGQDRSPPVSTWPSKTLNESKPDA